MVKETVFNFQTADKISNYVNEITLNKDYPIQEIDFRTVVLKIHGYKKELGNYFYTAENEFYQSIA